VSASIWTQELSKSPEAAASVPVQLSTWAWLASMEATQQATTFRVRDGVRVRAGVRARV
jgi:hypothetical protein